MQCVQSFSGIFPEDESKCLVDMLFRKIVVLGSAIINHFILDEGCMQLP